MSNKYQQPFSTQAPFLAAPLDTQFYNMPETRFQPTPRFWMPHRSVFERLTDHQYYTVRRASSLVAVVVFHFGTHKERFDEFGNGRGLAGREYLFINDGMTESPNRAHEVFSSTVKYRELTTGYITTSPEYSNAFSFIFALVLILFFFSQEASCRTGDFRSSEVWCPDNHSKTDVAVVRSRLVNELHQPQRLPPSGMATSISKALLILRSIKRWNISIRKQQRLDIIELCATIILEVQPVAG
eukprot:284819339_2